MSVKTYIIIQNNQPIQKQKLESTRIRVTVKKHFCLLNENNIFNIFCISKEEYGVAASQRHIMYCHFFQLNFSLNLFLCVRKKTLIFK